MEHNLPSVPIEHQDVPQAHRGLHDFLYGAGDQHGAETVSKPIALHDQVTAVDQWCELAGGSKIAGVYAVLDQDQKTQFVGISRHVSLALSSHQAAVGPQTCAFVRVQAFNFPKREEMEAVRQAWLDQLDYTPTGHAEEGDRWASTISAAATTAMTPAERQAHAEKKLKLQQAMADPAAQKVQPSVTNEEQRQNLIAAIAEDDWSSVIQQQTLNATPPDSK
ncbi:MAG: GIY-YIG nuclease family protein [Aphanocapsa sp. GSE-SYN-MK-11-07L]|jgi:hypothetical protein|nr:GIY-YIG nuclease family protein [Aphanocapsa sp. GSE-SYN-MK-11-07L]